MKKYLSLFALLVASAAYGQSAPVMVDFSGVPANAQPTQAQLNASVLGTPGNGTFTGGSGNANLIVVTATNSPCFPAATLIGGTPQNGCGNKVLQWTTTNPPTGGNFLYQFRSGSKTAVSQGVFFCADFDQGATGQYSNHQINGASGTEVNGLLGPNPSPGGLSLENNAHNTNGVLTYHGGSCLTDPTAWRWITTKLTNGAPGQIQIWDAGITTMLFNLTADASTGGNGISPNPGQLEFGLSGGETEVVGHHLYWKDAMIDDVTATFPLLPATTVVPLWAGIVAPARATDWTTAGVIGGIPSASYTQCGATIAAYSGTAATINTQLGTCSANQFVLLGPGIFNLTTQVVWPQKSNLVLRGSGPTTKLVFSSAVSGTLIAVTGSSGTTAFTEWTAGYAQGTNQLTVASTTGAVANQSVAIMDQCEDAFSGDTCSTGTSTDNGNFFNCSEKWASSSYGCSSAGSDGTQTFRWQQEQSLITNVSGGVLTLQDKIRHPNWASARTPHVTISVAPLQYVGVENMTLDASATASGGSPSSIAFRNVIDYWARGVEVINSQLHCLGDTFSSHGTFEQNYCVGGQTAVAHCIARAQVAKSLYQNNICIGFSPSIHTEQANDSSVTAYNFVLFGNAGDTQNDDLGEAFKEHSNGAAYELWEGNIAALWRADITHGSEPMQTTFRNFFWGWDSCATGQCGTSHSKDFETNALIMDAYARYHNHIGNVLGTPGYHTLYTSTGTPSNAVILVGEPNGVTPSDPIVTTTTMLWGNYDTVNSAVRFNAGENGSGAPVYPALASPSSTLPASFYLSSKPSWFGSLPWPPIGPDVSSGNIGQCSGSFNVAGQFNGLPSLSNAQCGNHGITIAWGSHANANPAMNCYLNVMGGTVDGMNPPTNFDPNVCYAGAPVSPGVSINPSSVNYGSINVGANASQVFTITSTTSVNLVMGAPPATITGTNAGDFGLQVVGSQCSNGLSLPQSSTCLESVLFTPSAGGARSAQLNIFDNVSGSPQVIPLSGTGVAIVGLSPTSLAFGLVPQGTSSATQTTTLSNGTGSTQTISGFTVTGINSADFSQTNTCGGTIVNGASCTFTFTFKPLAGIGTVESALLTVTTSSGSPTCSLSGTSAPTSAVATSAVFSYNALPLPLPPALSSLTLTTAQGGSSYVTAQGLSQNGVNWLASDPVRLIGSGFAQNSTVTFDATPLAATFVSSTEVDVTLPASMVLLPLAPTAHTFTVTTPAPVPIALVQKIAKDAGIMTQATLAFASATKAGDWIGVAVRLGSASIAGLKVSDTSGNLYRMSVAAPQARDGSIEAIFYAEGVKGGVDSITVGNNAPATLRMAILEYSGVAQSGSLDSTLSGQGAGTFMSAGLVTHAPGELILGEFLTANSATFSAGSGFAIEATAGNKLMVEDTVQKNAGAITATAQISATDNWAGAVASFKP